MENIITITISFALLIQTYRLYICKRDFMTFEDYLSNSISQANRAMNEYNKIEGEYDGKS